MNALQMTIGDATGLRVLTRKDNTATLVKREPYVPTVRQELAPEYLRSVGFRHIGGGVYIRSGGQSIELDDDNIVVRHMGLRPAPDGTLTLWRRIDVQ